MSTNDLIAVIGGGIAGLSVSAELSSRGFNLWVFEEHESIGLPKHCTGLISFKTFKEFRRYAKNCVLNEFNYYVIKTDDLKYRVELRFKEPVILVDRVGLEREVAEAAMSNNVRILTKHKVLDVVKDSGNGGVLVRSSKLKRRFPKLILAEGAKREIALSLGIYRSKPKFLAGLQCVVTCRNPPDSPIIYVGGDVSRELFGWIVPVDSGRAIVGVADNPLIKSVTLRSKHKHLLNVVVRGEGVTITGISEWFGGLIPMDRPIKPVQSRNLLVVGDAASHIKPLTGGGLYAVASLLRCLRSVKDFSNPLLLNECMKPTLKLMLRQYRVKSMVNIIKYWRALRLAYISGFRTIKVSNYDAFHESLPILFK